MRTSKQEPGLAKLISFDIDGTLEVGDPPGCVTINMVRTAQAMGYRVGSCSDRPISTQQAVWEEHDLAVDFMVLKHQLGDVRARFQADEYYHVGDSDMDRYFAERAGFIFVTPDSASQQLL